MSSRSANQHLTASREGASIAVFKDRKVLLVRRKRAPFAGLWSLPGGKTEPHETPRQTAMRELREETGIEAEIQGVIDTVKIAPEEGGPSYRLTVFYGHSPSGTLEPGGDTKDARWTDLDDIETLSMTPGTARLIWMAAHRVRRG